MTDRAAESPRNPPFFNAISRLFHPKARSNLGCLSLVLASLPTPTATLAQSQSAEPLRVEILYAAQRIDRPPVLSNLVARPDDEGERGAELGTVDNATTGRFLNQEHTLETLIVEADESLVDALRPQLAGAARTVLLNAGAATLLAIADLPEAADDLLFNVASTEVALRGADCRANLLHTSASRAMLGDALMQFLALRRWRELFLVTGNRPGDLAFAAALKHSIRKFGLELVAEKAWIDDADLRRNASQEVPAFTRARDYDAVLVADEDRDFSPYVLYNTWLPRPVAGSAGLMPVIWSPVIEQWGAAQLQSRFGALADRGMNGIDYAAWAAVRAIGEAVTRTGETAPAAVRDYLLSDDFELAGFKGASLGFRTWNGQLRQPVPLVHGEAVVATAPLPGYLHARTELDTLGLDEPESACTAFGGG